MIRGLKQALLRYWLAMNAASLQAGAHSARAYVMLATGHTLNDSVPTLNVKGAGCIFLLSFGKGILDYLDAHPLPISLIEGSTPAVPRMVPISSVPQTTTQNPT